ncbi:hypothetical protein J3F83DRAFT_95324 [Trichoderma novae-zelandiae]
MDISSVKAKGQSDSDPSRHLILTYGVLRPLMLPRVRSTKQSLVTSKRQPPSQDSPRLPIHTAFRISYSIITERFARQTCRQRHIAHAMQRQLPNRRAPDSKRPKVLPTWAPPAVFPSFLGDVPINVPIRQDCLSDVGASSRKAFSPLTQEITQPFDAASCSMHLNSCSPGAAIISASMGDTRAEDNTSLPEIKKTANHLNILSVEHVPWHVMWSGPPSHL